MLDNKSYLLMNIRYLSRFTSLSFFGLLACSAVNAVDELDIRADEAADICDAEISQVRVSVENVGSGGILTVELYDDPDNFLNKKGRKQRIRVAAVEGCNKVCFNIEEQGTYAVAAYHDVDANRKLKKRWNMTPDEPFGLSNNPKLKFGFPKFSKSAFTTEGLGADITINLRKP